MNQQTIHVNEESGCAEDARRISSTSSHPSEELNKSNIILTNRGLQRYGSWSKAKVLQLITSKFKQFVEAQLSTKIFFNETINERRLWVTIHSGLYSTLVLKILLNKGMSIHTIIKAMKLGLISLSSCELSYFKCFNIYSYMLEFENMWTDKYNFELISNLRAIGIAESDCWNIIIHGVGFQSACMLRHLLLSGIDIPGIINWQSPVNQSSDKIILFLKHIGVEQKVIELAEQYGIDEEIEQILSDLGLEQMEEESSHEIICKCSLTVLESDTCNLGITQSFNKVSESDSVSTDKIDYVQYDCQCGHAMEKKTVEEFTGQRNDYLRQNIMVPIAWAMARTLKYKPSDFVYYMAYELLRWKNINPEKKGSIQNAIALATVKMDHELVTGKNLEKAKLIKDKNEEALANIPCLRCKQHQDLNFIKKACSKCMKKSRKRSGDCEFPEICSSCKIEPSSKHEACQFSQLCSSCKIIDNSSKKSEVYRFPDCCNFCKITGSQFKKCELHQLPQFFSSCKIADSSPKTSECQFPRLCSSCRINDNQSKIFEECQFSQICSSCKITDRPSENLDACQFPQVCSSCKITDRPSENLDACQFPQVCSSCKITDSP